MSDVVLYIATSLDGYIARRDGSLDWLPQPETGAEDYGYAGFYDSIDALVMGANTFETVQSFGDWPYPGKPTLVFTTRDWPGAPPEVYLHAGEPQPALAKLHEQGARRIWLVGGGEMVAAFLRRDLIDEMILTLCPVLLGEGLPLFPATDVMQLTWELKGSCSYPDGLAQLHYRRRRE